MDHFLNSAVFLMLLGLTNASFLKNYSDCELIVSKWISFSMVQEVEENKHALQDLLFFLHVPRTGGRTYFNCLLRKLYTNSQKCPPSYDKLRFDPRKKRCRLFVSHNDYSMMSKLPQGTTSIMTILRHPVDRVISTYEFSVEVAARFLVHPNINSVTQMTNRLHSQNKQVNTLDIWPWNILVPWMREDLFKRRDMRKFKVLDDAKIKSPYFMKDIVMPLYEYINDPVAHDIIHNGAIFQVLGLTNNSFFEESHEVRHCVQKYEVFGESVLDVAKKRLNNMFHIGLTKKHKESAIMFADMVASKLTAQILESKSGINSSYENSGEIHSEQKPKEIDINFSSEKLLEVYEHCVSHQRKIRLKRQALSLKQIYPANFSKEDRQWLPNEILKQIKSLNNLDLELYNYAQEIFAKQHKYMVHQFLSIDMFERMLHHMGRIMIMEIMTLIVVMILLLGLAFNTRRSWKVKI